MVFRRLLQFSLGVAPHDDQSNPFATSSPLVRSFETTELRLCRPLLLPFVS
jgi:hypothetical protein